MNPKVYREPTPVLITERETSPSNDTVVRTPSGLPDVLIKTMTPIAQVLVRAARTFLQSLVGFLFVVVAARPLAENLGVMIPAPDFLDALKIAAGFAVAPTVISFLQNLIELLARVDESFPKARA